MRTTQSFVVVLLASVLGLVPTSVVAQSGAILLVPSSKKENWKPKVYVVSCRVLTPTSVSGCSVIPADKSTCGPGDCSFHKGDVADYPGVAIYGVSGNSTCQWVYVPGALGRYYYHCW